VGMAKVVKGLGGTLILSLRNLASWRLCVNLLFLTDWLTQSRKGAKKKRKVGY
jgi:hypothetical protein